MAWCVRGCCCWSAEDEVIVVGGREAKGGFWVRKERDG